MVSVHMAPFRSAHVVFVHMQAMPRPRACIPPPYLGAIWKFKSTWHRARSRERGRGKKICAVSRKYVRRLYGPRWPLPFLSAAASCHAWGRQGKPCRAGATIVFYSSLSSTSSTCADCIVAIGGGGFIPARMLRTFVKIPILAVSLELYDDATNTRKDTPTKIQWFDDVSGVGKRVQGKRVLIVDEVDDSRTTLQVPGIKPLPPSSPSPLLRKKRGTYFPPVFPLGHRTWQALN